MLNPEQLHDGQQEAVAHMLEHDGSMLWLGMGSGKTIVTLTSIIERMKAGQVQKVLIWGPLRVVQAVWAREARKWSHTQHLRCSLIHGNRQQRRRALFADADIYLCNYENMNWLTEELMHYYISQDKPLPFQMCVYDEVSKLKNANTARMNGGKRDRQGREVKLIGWRKIIPHVPYAVGLTGTPASNGYLDLHGQYLAVDGGERLGEYITHFKDNYFQSDYQGWTYTPTETGKALIEEKISDITIKQDSKHQSRITETNLMVDLPPKARKAYDEMEDLMFTQLDSGVDLEVFSASSVSNKLLQMINGSPYLSVESSEYEELHNAKLDALGSVLEEAAGSPVLCSYSFRSDAERIMKRFKKYKPVNMTATKGRDTEKVIDQWCKGNIRLMIGHPASIGHGIDGLQTSGHIIVWFGLNWSLELYEQLNARIDRQGQTEPVQLIRILGNDTVDLAVAQKLMQKADDQEGLKHALQCYRDGLITNDLKINFW
ncbi:MAG: SNF2-related protein [Pontibacterium sp.]